jgi:uncharacterized protein
MTTALLFLFRLGSLLILTAPAAPPEWTPEVFDYDRPAQLDVRDLPDPGPPNIPTATRQQQLVFKDLRGEDVPVLITYPKGSGPFPVAILVHGFTSSKEQVTSLVAARLLQRGFATVAADLPMHGARQGPPEALFEDTDSKKVYAHLVQAVVDIRQTIDLLERRRELDTSKGVYLVGYSMGGWLAALAGGAERRVLAMILMVPVSEATPVKPPPKAKGAAKPKDEPKPLLDAYPVLRPTGAIAHLNPRPVLIQAGELDGYLRKSAVDALLAAAHQPKELRWYPCGHILNDRAVADAAEWLFARLNGEELTVKPEPEQEKKPAARVQKEGAKERKREGAKKK